MRSEQQRHFEAMPKLEDWLLEAADKPVTLLTSGNFDDIRNRVRVCLTQT